MKPTYNGHTAYEIALMNPHHAIEGWRQGAYANGDRLAVVVLTTALAIQDRWRNVTYHPTRIKATER